MQPNSSASSLAIHWPRPASTPGAVPFKRVESHPILIGVFDHDQPSPDGGDDWRVAGVLFDRCERGSGPGTIGPSQWCSQRSLGPLPNVAPVMPSTSPGTHSKGV